MIIDVTASGVGLRELRVFDDFHIEVVHGVDLDEALTVAGAGKPIGDGDVFVSTGWIRSVMAEREEDDEAWQTGFEAMLGYARSRGWVSEDGDGFRSHVTRLAP